MIEYILFYETSGHYGFCSNFFKSPITIDNIMYDNVEQYFQSAKFKGPKASKRSLEYANLIAMADSPSKVKMLGTQKKNLHFGKIWKLNKKDDRIVNDLIDEYKDVTMRKDWEKAKLIAMIEGLIAKFKNNTLASKLKSIPDNALLVEHTRRDSIWADGGDGGSGKIGTNYLGKMLTVISHTLKYGDCSRMSEELKIKVRIR